MVFIYKVLGLGILLAGGYLVYGLFTGIVGNFVQNSFLKNIYTLVMLAGWFMGPFMVMVGITWMFGGDPINTERERLEKEAEEQRLAEEKEAEEQRLAKEAEEQRLASLPKCDGCGSPLDSVTQTYTTELKKTVHTPPIAKYGEYGIFSIYQDITKTYEICCKNCNHCFLKEEIEENKFIELKAQCPQCEEFDTSYSEVHSLDKTHFTVSCHCNSCGNDWRATQREEALQNSYEAKIKKEAEDRAWQEKREKEKQKEEELIQQRIQQNQANITNAQTTHKQRIGVRVRYRIRGLSGHDIREVVPVNNPIEAEKMIKMKYPGQDIHIIGSEYAYS